MLKGWLDVEFEEIGVQHLEPGTVIPAFNGPMHRELASGDGFALLLLVTRKSMSGDDRQHIVVQQERDSPYEAKAANDGLLQRDFVLQQMTGGRIVAHALKARRGKRPAARPHPKGEGFRFLYVTDGWVEIAYDDVGSVRLERGSVVYEPPAVGRTDIARSDDVVMVEVGTPGDWKR